MPKIKRSETAIKTSNPGRLSVKRFHQADGTPRLSVMHNELLGQPKNERACATQNLASTQVRSEGGRSKQLLAPIFQNGELVYEVPPLDQTRAQAIKNWKLWKTSLPVTYGLSPKTAAQKQQLLDTYNPS